MNEGEPAKLDRLADALRAPWTFIATLSPARDCDEIWKDSSRALSAALARGSSYPEISCTSHT